MNNKIFNLSIATAGGILGGMFGGIDHLFKALCVMIVVDTITGMFKAFKFGEYSSSKFKAGLFKKTGYFLALIMVVQLDYLAGNTGVFRGAMILFTISNEMLSMLENLGLLGVEFPSKIKNAIELLKTNNDKDVE